MDQDLFLLLQPFSDFMSIVLRTDEDEIAAAVTAFITFLAKRLEDPGLAFIFSADQFLDHFRMIQDPLAEKKSDCIGVEGQL